MASPHPPYTPHSGPSYYHHPPPPPQHYPNGPAPAPFYPYHATPMNGQGHTPMLHQPAPRAHGTGRGRHNPSQRGGMHGYAHYHQPMHMHPAMSPPVSPEIPFNPQKYPPHLSPVAYSPGYGPGGPYPPPWQAQTLSPLPKQLSMPPPVFSPAVPPQASTPQFMQPEPPTQVVEQAQKPQDSAASASEVPQDPVEEPSQPVSSPPADEKPEELLAEAPSSSSSTRPVSPQSKSTSAYVVWSRRPRDPSRAPGIIISHRAFPPEDIVSAAADVPSPPPSPRRRQLKLKPAPAPPKQDEHEASPGGMQVPSSSATDTTTASATPADTPVPGSPMSSRTSVSVAVVSPPTAGTAKAPAATDPESSAEPTPAPAAAEPAPAPKAEPAPSAPAGPTPVADAAAATAPKHGPAAAAPKKSWASLLQSGDGSASSSKSRLPTSSVVGISIPADASTAKAGGAHALPANSREVLALLNATPGNAGPPLRITPRGLVNTGNMCFANAVLQVLLYCPPFHRLLADLGRHLPVAAAAGKVPLLEAMVQFVKEFAPPKREESAFGKGKERQEDEFYEPESFIPVYVYDAMKEKPRFANMITGHQEDAEEFLGFFLDTLEEELLALSNALQAKPTKPEEDGPQDEGWYEVGKRNRTVVARATKSADSPITRIFGGKFRSTLRAPHQHDSVMVEDWRSLRLDIQRESIASIRDALQQISHPQPVQISSPTRPGVVIDATQQALVESLPPILVLHLKRFHYDTAVSDVVKISKQIAYGPDLEIGSDLVSPTKRTAHPVKYQLFSVLYHHGTSAAGGHYTLDVLHPNRDLTDRPRAAWIRIDDELVSDVRPEDVFGPAERDDRNAYLLFYRRMSGWGPRT